MFDALCGMRRGARVLGDQGQAYVGTTFKVKETTRSSPGSGTARVKGLGEEWGAGREEKARGGLNTYCPWQGNTYCFLAVSYTHLTLPTSV